MFDVPQAVVDATVVRTANVTEKCARILLHTAFTAPAGSKLCVYGPSLPITELVVRSARALCPWGNVGENNSTKVVIHRDDGTTVELQARPGAVNAVRGDDVSHVFVVQPGYLERGMDGQFLLPLLFVCVTMVFVGSDDSDMAAARLVCGADSIAW
jgi:hypothetical protein